MNGRPTFRGPQGPWSGGGGGGLPSFTPAPRDVLILRGVVFVTGAFQYFEPTAALLGWLRLTGAVWTGLVWQLVTYPFIGYGDVGLWFLLALLILFWFGRDVYYRLGRKRFWRTLLFSAVTAAVVAEVVYLAGALLGAPPASAFQIMQGQTMLLTIVIAAFATVNADATILLFFVLPVRARWFLWLEVLFAFIAFLPTKDLPGFLGLVTAVGVTYGALTAGGPKQMFRQWRLRAERWRLQRELDRERRKRKMRVIDGGGEKGEGRDDEGGGWVN